jgi:hypothetical protein
VGLKHFARRMMSRKAAALARIKDPHRTIEIACFLRLGLLQLSDASLTLLDHQIAASGAAPASAWLQSRRAGCVVSIGSWAISRAWPMTRRSAPAI